MQQKRLLGKSLRYQTASRGGSPTASIQFRRTSPTPSQGPQLQQLATTTIRVMAWPERATLPARARKATHCESLRYQAASRGGSPTASIQFRRALPAPSHRIALMTTFSISFVYVCTPPSPFRWRGRQGSQITCAKLSPLKRHYKSSETAQRRSRCKTRATSKLRRKLHAII